MVNCGFLLLTVALVNMGLFISPSGGVPVSPYADFLGKFKLIKSENFDAYMEAVGVSWLLASLASHASPTTEISELDGNWEIKTSTTFKSTDIKFKLAEPFQEVTADGRHCQSVITRLDDTLVHKQVCDGKDYEILRRFQGNEMTMTLTAPGPVVATRIYKRI